MENWTVLIAASIIATAIISLLILENLLFVTDTPTQRTNQTPSSLNISAKQFPLITVKLTPGSGKHGTYNLTVWLDKIPFKTTLKTLQNNLVTENGT